MIRGNIRHFDFILMAAALALAVLGVDAVTVAESWRGLTGFARLIGITHF